MGDKRISKKENLFAASRFVLPEHRELYLEMKREQERYLPPALDEEQRARISQFLWQAWQTEASVTIHYFADGERHSLCGWVRAYDPIGQRVKIAAPQGTKWLTATSILAVDGED